MNKASSLGSPPCGGSFTINNPTQKAGECSPPHEKIWTGKDEGKVDIPEIPAFEGWPQIREWFKAVGIAIYARGKRTYPVMPSLSLCRCSIATTHPSWSALV